MSFYRRSVVLFGLVSIALGIALVAQTARAGGGSVGYALGLLFVALGAGRLYIARRR